MSNLTQLYNLETNYVSYGLVPHYLISGSFNPLHKGHLRMADYVEFKYGSVGFEFSVRNCDKTPTPIDKTRETVLQFTNLARPVVVTGASYFVGKAAILPNSVFVIGTDTAYRIFDVKYYYDSFTELVRCFQNIEDYNCSFLVLPRVDKEDSIKRFEDVLRNNTPLKHLFVYDELFTGISISSTQLRNKSNGEDSPSNRT